MNFLTRISLFITFTVFALKSVNCGKILVFLPLATKSHVHFITPLVRGLAEKGHEIDLLVPVEATGMPSNVRQMVCISVEDIFGNMRNPIQVRSLGKFGGFVGFRLGFVTTACEKVYETQIFQEFLTKIKSGQVHYDLVFFNGFMNNCFSGLLHIINAPFIVFTSMPIPSFIAQNIGLDLPTSYVPNPFLKFTDQMTFGERTLNFLMHHMTGIIFQYTYYADSEKLYRKYLGQDLPSVVEIDRRVSMIMQNSHFVLNYPRPLLPDVIEIGGIHCQPAKPLPKDLEEFVGQNEFIFFSLGSIFRAAEMPLEFRDIFVKVFSQLKYRVLWKWDEDIENLPENVKLIKWAPQQDILGHKNIKLFITHGGLLSTQETTYHGVPLLGIPLFGDQDLNVKQAELGGYATSLEILDLTEELLYGKVQSMLNDTKYFEKAKKLSKIIRDEIQPPVQKAVYWSEYIMRHKGAEHLRAASRDLNYFQYHSIDVLAFLISSIVSIIFVLIWIFKKFLKFLQFLMKSSSKSSSIKRKKE